MKTNILKRIIALAMTAVMAFSISGGVSAADAATAAIDTSRSTSLTLYKYDLTGAENDGVWDSESYVSTGIADEQVNTALSQHAIQGVEFTYRKLADLSIYKGTTADGHQETVPLYAFTENTKSGSKETIDFLSALGLTTNDAYRTDHDGKQNRVWYFKSDVLIEALDHALTTNSTSTKDALEKYMAVNGGTAMPETDENGYSKVDTQMHEKSTRTPCQTSTCCAAASPARHFQQLANASDLKIPEALSSLKLPDWLRRDDLRIFCLRTALMR